MDRNADSERDEPLPACPACRATATIEAFVRFGERMYFCTDCAHSWSLLRGTPAPPDRDPDSR